MNKQYLRSYRDLKSEVNQLEEKIQEIERSIQHIKTTNNDGMPRGSSGENYRIESLIDKKCMLLDRHKHFMDELIEKQIKIETQIENIDDSRERQLLRYYYIDGMTWEQVCVKMSYSWSQVHRIHASALNHLRINME